MSEEEAALFVSCGATAAAIRHSIEQLSKPIQREDTLKEPTSVAVLSAAAFWRRVDSFPVDWTLAKLDARLSPLFLSRCGWQLAAGSRTELRCDACHRRKLWAPPPPLTELSPTARTPSEHFSLEQHYGTQFACTLQTAHHSLCIFQRTLASADYLTIPDAHQTLLHTHLFRTRWLALTERLSDLPPLPLLATSPLFSNAAPHAALQLHHLLTDPDSAWQDLRPRLPVWCPDKLQSNMHAALFLLALCGWSTPGVTPSSASSETGQFGFSPPKPLPTSATSTRPLVCCRWCRRTVDLSLFLNQSDELDVQENPRKYRKLGDDSDSAVSMPLSRIPSQFDPVAQHRWYCPWSSIPPAGEQEDRQQYPGYILCIRALTEPGPSSTTPPAGGSEDLLRKMQESGLLN